MTVKVLSIDSGKRRIALSIKALTKKSEDSPEKEVSEEDSVPPQDQRLPKMLKKFLKKSKTEEEEETDNF